MARSGKRARQMSDDRARRKTSSLINGNEARAATRDQHDRAADHVRDVVMGTGSMVDGIVAAHAGLALKAS
jgi:hypothetical protein